MNTDRATVDRVAESLDWLDLSIFAADTVRHATALLRALLRERDEERAEAEQWQVRCAGCLTAAEGHTSDPAEEGDYGWTLAYQRTLELRQAYDALLRERDGMGTIAPCYRL